MSDEKVVQPAAPSTGEAEQAKPPQAFDETKIRELVSKEVETVRRQLQSDKDKAVSEVRREAERARAEAFANRREADELATQFGAVDPQAAELASLRARDRRYREQESHNMSEQQRQTFDNQFRDKVAKIAKKMGVDPSDSRIDWGLTSSDYLERLDVVTDSVEKIATETRNAEKVAFEKTFSEKILAQARKELSMDSVDTSAPASGMPGKYTLKQVDAMSSAEVRELRKTHGGKDLMTLVKEGIIKE